MKMRTNWRSVHNMNKTNNPVKNELDQTLKELRYRSR